MELLIIKNGQAYIRCINNEYIEVKLDKASVFPLDQIEQVKNHLAALRQKGFAQACLKKLVLTEEDF